MPKTVPQGAATARASAPTRGSTATQKCPSSSTFTSSGSWLVVTWLTERTEVSAVLIQAFW